MPFRELFVEVAEQLLLGSVEQAQQQHRPTQVEWTMRTSDLQAIRNILPNYVIAKHGWLRAICVPVAHIASTRLEGRDSSGHRRVVMVDDLALHLGWGDPESFTTAVDSAISRQRQCFCVEWV